MTCQTAVSLGVYVLGAADASERLRVEAHLPGCAACRAELARLAPLPGLLASVPPDLRPAASGPAASSPAASGPAASSPAAPGPVAAPAGVRRGPVRRVLTPGRTRRGPSRGVPGPGRPRPSRPRLAAALTAVAAAVGGLAGGYLLAPHGGASQPAAPAMTVSGANPAAHVRAVAALTATSWGTSIRLRVSGLPLNVQCWLVVRSRSGQSEVAGVWDAW
ncbi:MAG TPA: zf-HC2 domain-containing protein, partial [Streptosporangiaceae bacterium]